MQDLRKSGAAGSHGDKTKVIPRKQKHKDKDMKEGRDTHCSDKCCGSDVTREDCKCSPDCEHCNCNDDSIPEGDLVLDRSALIAHLQREIEKFASQETDVEKLSYILKQLSGQKVKARNKKYFTVSDEDIKEALRRVAHGY